MFSIHDNGQNYQVVFKQDDDAMRLGKYGFESVQTITALIFDNRTNVVAGGWSIKSEQDEPDYTLGMEIALGRALKQWGASRELKGKFFAALNRALRGEEEIEQAQMDFADLMQRLAAMAGTYNALSSSYDLETSPSALPVHDEYPF